MSNCPNLGARRAQVRTMARLLLSVALATILATPAAAGSYVACDNGLRCFAAPCPSTNAYDVKTKKARQVVQVDTARMTVADRQALEHSNGLYEGTFVVSGRIVNRKARGPAGSRSQAVLVADGVERKSTWSERRACRR